MQLKALQFTALFLLLLVAGLFWGTWFALSRSIEDFSATEFMHIGKTIIKNVGGPMKIILPACILFIMLSMGFYPQKNSTAYYMCVISFVLIIITLYITVGIEVPIDNDIKQWTLSSIPGDWEAIRTRWQFFHSLRTFTALASFASFVTSVVFYPKNTINTGHLPALKNMHQ
jgi:uncharacterized membrane protein